MEKVTAAVLITRREATAEASLARRRDLRKLGTAIAAMIKITLTTMSSSIREKPRCLRMNPPEANIRDARALPRRNGAKIPQRRTARPASPNPKLAENPNRGDRK